MAEFAEISEVSYAWFPVIRNGNVILQHELDGRDVPLGFLTAKDAEIYMNSNHKGESYHLRRISQNLMYSRWQHGVIILKTVAEGDTIADLLAI